MPDPHDTLSIFAEVSVALVGFSGIVIAFGRRSQGALTQLEQRRLSNLFVFGGGVLLISLTGISLLHTAIDRSLIWTIESTVWFVLVVPWAVLDRHRIRCLDDSEKANIKNYIIYPFYVVGIGILLLQLGNAILVHNSWPFFLALVFSVAFALQQFILLVRMGTGDT